MDRTTEAIAHFIGLFTMAVEEARKSDVFEKFTPLRAQADDLPSLPGSEIDFAAPYQLEGYDPGIVYRPTAPEIVPWTSGYFFDSATHEVEIGPSPATVQHWFPETTLLSAAGSMQIVIDIEPLGSVANYLHQGISLSDNDYFGVGGNGLIFTPVSAGDAAVITLFETAARISPLPDVAMRGSTDNLVEYATLTAGALTALDAQRSDDGSEDADEANLDSLFIEMEHSLEGIFVDGQEREAPELQDHLSLEERSQSGPHSDEPFEPNVAITDDGVEIDASVTIETGDNVLINDVVLKNMWTAATVTAVVGDHTEINAIVQINARWDSDSVTEAIGSWNSAPSATEAFNIATFERYDPSTGSTNAQDGVSGFFPQHWAVTEVEGDLMIVNWIQQLTFMQDDDIGVISSSGATSYVYSGSNTATNGISIYEMGFAYDLIVIGGSVYDVNIIEQLNILADNDLIGAVSDFQTTGPGSYSTSDNLLWNQAHIYNAGSGGPYGPLSADYQKTAAALSNGQHEIADGVLSDPAFAGQAALRVLHVEGDLVNVQHVKQTNILGDNDQIALARGEGGVFADAEWSVATGKNALLNSAAIVDLDSLGKTYVGGGQYSQDLLVQADIISTDPAFGGQNPDVLVSEAIAFLDDSMTDAADNGYYAAGDLDPDNAVHGDALQSMIG